MGKNQLQMDCPKCDRLLFFIEIVSDNDEEKVTTWSCIECNILIYIHEFKGDN